VTPAALVRTLRTRLSLTQTALADALGVHVRTVQHWERGGEDPREGYAPGAEQVEALARLAGVEIVVGASGWRVEG
jgi:transcriptional regulator with XRE-family HTH domain